RGHGGAGVAGTNRSAPAAPRPAFRELLEDTSFAPNAVALRPQPLWPIVRADSGGANQQHDQGNHGARAAKPEWRICVAIHQWISISRPVRHHMSLDAVTARAIHRRVAQASA